MRWAGIFFAIVGATSVIAGLGVLLVASSQSVTPDARRGSLLRRSLPEVFDRPRRVERFVYRHHRLFGGAIVAGALLLLGVLNAGQTRLLEAVLLGGSGARAAAVLALTLAIAVLVIGMVVLVRPSALKGVEALSNRWIQLFPATIRTSRQIGVLLLAAGIVCLVAAARMAGA